MKISTRGKYALEIVMDLALHSGTEHPESLKNVAGRRGLSEKYLERIAKNLKKAGVLKSSRGALGGYSLAYDPENITVEMVLRAAEGNLAPVECLVSDTVCRMSCRNCPTRDMWNGMWDTVLSAVSEIRVSDVIEKCSRR